MAASSSRNNMQRTAMPSASHGSMTMTTTTDTAPLGPSLPFNVPTLRLRAEPEPRSERRIQWAEDVIDNEGMGKKSSKVCCIYHKPREAGESSEDDSSSSSSSSSEDSDSEPDISRAQPARRRSARQPHHTHDGHSCDHDHGPGGESSANGKQRERKRSPNAYERLPKRRHPKPEPK